MILSSGHGTAVGDGHWRPKDTCHQVYSKSHRVKMMTIRVPNMGRVTCLRAASEQALSDLLSWLVNVKHDELIPARIVGSARASNVHCGY